MASAAGGRMYVVETDRKKEKGIDRIMISENLKKYATEKFEGRRELLAPVMPVIEEKLKQCSEEEVVLMKFLYGTMPVRDAGEYGFNLFLSYVKHALMLREKVAWCKELPEDVFVNYVLYDRINSEDITDCRPFFYEQIMGRVAGMSLWEAILEINYWCAEHATYEATDSRTASPMTMYRSGKGRCGEESTFAVTAYRSVGIAARQVYTPRWAHCDDNHAWVEVFVDGEWHFLGACEPEEVLDTGWFSGPANRAILIHTRNFSDYVYSCTACLGNNLFQCTSQRNLHCNRVLNLSNNGNIFTCDRFMFFYRAVYIVESLYIKYGYSLLDRQSSGPYHTSGCLINKNNLITHRINLIQKMDLNPREFFNMLI